MADRARLPKLIAAFWSAERRLSEIEQETESARQQRRMGTAIRAHQRTTMCIVRSPAATIEELLEKAAVLEVAAEFLSCPTAESRRDDPALSLIGDLQRILAPA